MASEYIWPVRDLDLWDVFNMEVDICDFEVNFALSSNVLVKPEYTEDANAGRRESLRFGQTTTDTEPLTCGQQGRFLSPPTVLMLLLFACFFCLI